MLEDAQAARAEQLARERAKAAADARGVALMNDAVERCLPEFIAAARALGVRPPASLGLFSRGWWVEIQIYAAPGSEMYISATAEVRSDGSWKWSNAPWALSDDWSKFREAEVREGVREAFLSKLR